jgi:catecholate siderophore receptor
MFKSRVLLTSTALVCGLAAAAPAFAQNDQEDVIRVDGRYLSLDQLNAVKTPTPIIDVPQSLSIVSEVQIAEQGFANLGDILRYTPGLSISQGEGHRDAINIRGNQATGDFFLNGIRDDVQYYRPLYNLEQVEILRGSNALLFGRGGGGGVINRVTKSPVSGEDFTQASVSLDTFGAYQVTGDTNAVLTGTTAVRLNAFVEEMANHRDAFDGSRYGINPTLTTELGNETTLTLFYEYLNDDRVVDRGVPSVAYAGVPNRPLTGFDDFFFGSPEENNTTLEAHTFRARVEHEFTDQLRGNVTVQYADYDKAYQNLYAAGIDTSSTPNRVTLDGYRDTTTRTNLIVQGNLVGEFQTGIFSHTFLIGGEYGDQETANARWDNVFAANNDDRIEIDVTDPLTIPDFSFSAPARDRQSEVSFASLYLQDQIDVTDTFKVVLGARLDRFDVSVLDLRAVSATDDGRRGRVDEEISPRFGLIYKPAENVSVYASYSETFLPSAGDQFLTLSTTTEDIRPQVFENREIGAKWDVNDRLSFTAALFRLERGQFTTVDPDDASIVTTVAGSTTEGFELQLIGELLDGWTINAGYSWLDGEVEGGGSDGNVTRQTPEHMLSVWNRYQVNDRLALALGATYQDSFFVLEDNSVEVPDYLRFDAAVYYDLSDTTRIQLNVENLTDEDYFPDAHSNSNISTGEPTNARLTLHHRF